MVILHSRTEVSTKSKSVNTFCISSLEERCTATIFKLSIQWDSAVLSLRTIIAYVGRYFAVFLGPAGSGGSGRSRGL